VSTVLYNLGFGRTEAIPNWPEGPFKTSDFPILYTASRSQIEHVKEYAKTVGKLRGLSDDDQALLDSWAADFFLIGAYRKPVPWTVAAAKVAIEICYGHVTVYLHGENFRSEMARIRSQAGV
jgi:hypothetical protein